jgi:two-component system cell cycle sensor histidine kinase/response regulator CckA
VTQPLRVLLLEDHPGDAAVIRDRLAFDGVRCEIRLTDCQSSFEAALADGTFDLIIADYRLPGYDGMAALRHALTAQPDVPVILVSGTVSEEVAVKCLQFGATDYLMKGHLDRLAPAVLRAIAEAESRLTRKRAEVALVQSERRKAAVLDSVLDCIITMDAAGVVIEFNSAAERTFGYTKADAIGRPLADLIIPAASRQRHTDGPARYLTTGEGPLLDKVIEMTAMRSDGSELQVELAITVIHSEQAPIFTAVLHDITARKQADETRARLAAIVDSSDDAIFSMSLDDTILTWNAGAERLYGYSAEEMIGRSKMLLVPAGLRGGLKPILAKAARGEPGEPFETRRVRKDGSLVDISLTISPMTESGGRVTSLSAIGRDITSRKSTEVAVRDERDRAQRFLDTADVTLLALDVNGRITLINRKGCDLLGWTESELLGQDFLEMCLPERSRIALRKKFETVLDGDLSVVEAGVLTKSGEERLVEWRNTLLKDDVGRVIGTFSSGTDITERSQAIAALQTAEERMRFALQGANVGIWDMDYTTGVLRWSEILEAQYGLAPGTFGGTFEAFTERLHPDDRQAVLEAVGKATDFGTDFSILHRSIWPDGTVHWLSGAGRVLLGKDGQPSRGIGISQDVTKRHQLEQQYQQTLKMEAIGQLAGGVAHDFNNLLTIILGYCEMMLEDLGSTNACHVGLVQIQRAGLSAAGLTRQLLAFSRKEIISPELLDLNVVLANMRAMLRRLIREDVKIALTTGSELALVMADRGQIEQIVLNLAVNARDAMPKGGTLKIEVATVELDDRYVKTHASVRPGPYVALTVADTGEGIPPDVQTRMFEPFFTTKEPGQGTGLGLATVHGIVTQNGGSIEVASAVGVGTTFRLYFPQAPAAAGSIEVAVPVVHARRGGETVVVVEDEEGLRLLITSLLKRLGYTVLVAANAAQAIALFDEHHSIDLLLTDVVLPGGSGPDLSTWLVKGRPELKVLYMSGYTDEAIVHHGVLDPGVAFLSKPFTAQALGLKVREVLDQETVGRGEISWA